MTTSTLERLAKVRLLASNGEARRRRVAANLSPGDIAREIDAAESTVRRWEEGQRRPSGEKALVYLKVLDRLDAITKVPA